MRSWFRAVSLMPSVAWPRYTVTDGIVIFNRAIGYVGDFMSRACRKIVDGRDVLEVLAQTSIWRYGVKME